jgi:protoporphyrinogen oxidase
MSIFFPSPSPKREDELPPAKVAVLGAGIGGCFAAKFLRENGGKNLDIHVFAKKGSEVGGRAGVCHYDGHLYESGALILLPENKYMSDAAREYGEL